MAICYASLEGVWWGKIDFRLTFAQLPVKWCTKTFIFPTKRRLWSSKRKGASSYVVRRRRPFLCAISKVSSISDRHFEKWQTCINIFNNGLTRPLQTSRWWHPFNGHFFFSDSSMLILPMAIQLKKDHFYVTLPFHTKQNIEAIISHSVVE